MLVTVLMLVGFVVAVVAILVFTPALEKWATAAPAPADEPLTGTGAAGAIAEQNASP
jgi:hypothetical protein